MLRAARQQDQAVAAKKSWNVVVFSVGGRKLAARTEDVGGVAAWVEPVPVPSRTPFVGAMLKWDIWDWGGKYYAIDDCCPHMGSSLAGGRLEQGVVVCPDHAWRFSIAR